jgi:hypothetical protein
MTTQVFISYASDTSSVATVLESLRDVLAPEITDDPFDRPMGPHVDCFSTSQVACMLEVGVSSDELAHLLDCPICHDLVALSPNVSWAIDGEGARKPSEKFGRTIRDLILRPSSSPQSTVAAVLGLSDPVVAIDDPHRDITVTCELITSRSGDRIDFSSLRLEGAAAAPSGTLIDRSDESTIPRVVFKGARLSKDTRRSLAHNARVVAQIRVCGSLAGEPAAAFRGQAKVEFVRPLMTGQPSSNREPQSP